MGAGLISRRTRQGGWRLALRYTLCFCQHGDTLLMLFRKNHPHAGRWNGVGGKIESGESPRDCVRRETLEETGIELALAQETRFAGIVTWPPDDAVNGQGSGMHVYVAQFDDATITWPGERRVGDGLLRWQPVSWVCDATNGLVVENIPCFLPPMLRREPPCEHYCDYRGDTLIGVQRRPLAHPANEDDPNDNQQQAGDARRGDRDHR